MPYAALSDVQALAPQVPINAQSKPSDATVAQWIKDVEINTDAVLRGIGYQTPITGPNSIALVKMAVAHAVMAMVLRSRPNPEQDPENFQKRTDAFFKSLREPTDPLILDDAVQVDTPIKESAVRVSSNLKDLLDTGTYISRDMKF